MEQEKDNNSNAVKRKRKRERKVSRDLRYDYNHASTKLAVLTADKLNLLS